jgi:ADP-ribose pyrophosphatase YjhB (NUDIX family)
MMKRPKPIQGIHRFVVRRRPAISEVVREPTAGGIIFRHSPKDPKVIEILLIADSRGRWTIPKGHIEEGEKATDTAQREIREEVGLQKMKILGWLGKINFRYRRGNSLVLMTTEIFLVEALGNTGAVKPEKWMDGVAWMPANEALEKIEYEDIGKLILLGLKKIRSRSTPT